MIGITELKGVKYSVRVAGKEIGLLIGRDSGTGGCGLAAMNSSLFWTGCGCERLNKEDLKSSPEAELAGVGAGCLGWSVEVAGVVDCAKVDMFSFGCGGCVVVTIGIACVVASSVLVGITGFAVVFWRFVVELGCCEIRGNCVVL